MSKDLKLLQKNRAKAELTIKLLKVIQNFKSEEEPKIMLNKNDVNNVLANILVKRTE